MRVVLVHNDNDNVFAITFTVILGIVQWLVTPALAARRTIIQITPSVIKVPIQVFTLKLPSLAYVG